MKNLLRFSEQKKCVRRGDKASAARLLMRINSREKSLCWWGFNCFAPPPHSVEFLCLFLSSLKSPHASCHSCRVHLVDEWLHLTPQKDKRGMKGEKKMQGGKGDKKQPGLPADIYILQMYPESRQSDPHWLKKWKYSNNQALCSAQVPAGDRRAYREDEGYLDRY